MFIHNSQKTVSQFSRIRIVMLLLPIFQKFHAEQNFFNFLTLNSNEMFR